MKVTVDHDKCEAHGRCYNFAEDLFERGPKGKAVVLVPEIGEDDLDMMRNAEAAQMMCPAGAITVEED